MVQSSKPDVNLFDTITSDIDRRELMMKQAQFNCLQDRIEKVLLGDISNFYRDDFRFKEDFQTQQQQTPQDLSPYAKVEEIDDFVANGAILVSKQRKLVASRPIKAGTIIAETEPLVTVVDKQNITKYCSWCFKAHNPKPAIGSAEEDDPDSFVAYVTLKSCSRCHFTHYCGQECQRGHWSTHKAECNANVLKAMPTGLRLLLQTMRLKTDKTRQDHAEQKRNFESKILDMTSMASNVALEIEKSKLMTYAMVVFLKCPDLDINMENVKLILHILSILEVNAFGISDKTLLRAGTGLYYPTNLLNHSCSPNCVALFRGKTQFILSVRDLAEAESPPIQSVKLKRACQPRRHFPIQCDIRLKNKE